jgi:UDP-2-acetamido-2-deoxy-ribo-hexuluronate aminotransferase
MELFDDEVAARVRLGARYSQLLAEAFAGSPSQIRTPYVEPFNTCVYAQYTIEVENREFFETRMKALGVPTAVHYPLPLHLQPVFEHLGQRQGAFPVSEAAARRVISLPMHPYLTEEHQRTVLDAVRQAVG